MGAVVGPCARPRASTPSGPSAVTLIGALLTSLASTEGTRGRGLVEVSPPTTCDGRVCQRLHDRPTPGGVPEACAVATSPARAMATLPARTARSRCTQPP